MTIHFRPWQYLRISAIRSWHDSCISSSLGSSIGSPQDPRDLSSLLNPRVRSSRQTQWSTQCLKQLFKESKRIPDSFSR